MPVYKYINGELVEGELVLGACAKVRKLRTVTDAGEVWDDWCFKHHHWLNGSPCERTAADELIDSVAPIGR